MEVVATFSVENWVEALASAPLVEPRPTTCPTAGDIPAALANAAASAFGTAHYNADGNYPRGDSMRRLVGLLMEVGQSEFNAALQALGIPTEHTLSDKIGGPGVMPPSSPHRDSMVTLLKAASNLPQVMQSRGEKGPLLIPD